MVARFVWGEDCVGSIPASSTNGRVALASKIGCDPV